MGRVLFSIVSAMVACVVGAVELNAFRIWHLERLWGLDALNTHDSLILAAMVAAAISSYVFSRDPQFHERSRLLQTVGICFFAYVLFFPLLLVTSGFDLGETILHGAFACMYSIAPVLVIEYAVVCVARSWLKEHERTL